MRSTRSAVITAIITIALPAFAQAQATRTWVSGVGDDVNPCSRTAPCKTFAGAISKTATGGEINVLDSGGFGAVTITKSITIDGAGAHASILASLTNGVIINATTTSVIVLRNLSINGAGNGLNGIRYLTAGSVTVENTNIIGFTQKGIDVSLASSGNLTLNNVTIGGGAHGVRMSTTTGTLRGQFDGLRVRGAQTAVEVVAGATTVSNAVLAQNGTAALATTAGTLTVENALVTGNNIAVQSDAGATIRLINSSFLDNLTGFACGTNGTLATAGNNRKGGNSGGAVPVCDPNATVTIQ